MRRLALVSFIVAVLTQNPVTVFAHDPYETGAPVVVRQRAIAHGVSPAWAESIAHCESGHYDPRVLDGRRLGGAGEQGMVQLHPQGLLRMFYAYGYEDPFSVWSAADFLALAMSKGLAYHWSCA